MGYIDIKCKSDHGFVLFSRSYNQFFILSFLLLISLSSLVLFDRYLVLANMLMESEVNPFDGQEAKP